MSDGVGIWFRPPVADARAFESRIGDGKGFGRDMGQLDEICDLLGIPPFSRFWPEQAERICFDAAEGLEAIEQILPWLTDEKDFGLIHALKGLASDLEMVSARQARFVMYHY